MAHILGWTGKQVNEQELPTSDFANPFTESG